VSTAGAALVSDAMRFTPRTIIGALLVVALVVYGWQFKSIPLTPRILIGASLTIVLFIVAVFSRATVFERQPRSARIAFLVTSILGIALVGTTMSVGLHYLDADEVPRGEAPAVGFVPPAPAKMHRGFALGMGVQVERCDEPVHVTLVAAGTAEYWKDNARRLRSAGNFRLGIPEAHLAHLHFGMGEYLSDVTNPIDATPWPEKVVHLREKRVRVVHDMTVISARVPEWGWSQSPVVAHFDADWLEPRGRGNCYLRLPALSGDLTASATEQAAGRARHGESEFPCYKRGECETMTSERNHLTTVYRPREEMVHGNVMAVAAAGGDVVANDSIPEPNAVVEGDVAWTCDSRPRPNKRSVFSFSLSELEQQTAGNCSGFAVVAERDAGDRRDATILMMGILIAVGLGLLIESIMDWLRAEFPLREKKETRD
jgi:hypothetical protein